jgi:cytosine/adenosine deaminase-related metal-dependent hydrolase
MTVLPNNERLVPMPSLRGRSHGGEMNGCVAPSRLSVIGWGAQAVAIEGGALDIEGGIVREAAPFRQLRRRRQAADEIGDGAHLVTPGCVNARSHGREIAKLRQRIPDIPGELRSVGLRLSLTGD